MAEQEIYAIVRLRGEPDTHHSIRKTLSLLRLHKVNHAVIYPKTESIDGMLFKAKDKVTWGTIDKPTMVHLLKKRGELVGRKKLTDEYIKEHTKYKSIEDFVDAMFEGKAKLTDIPDLRPVFRLSPPRKGFKSLKLPYEKKGDLGYRGENMTNLIKRMA